MQLYQHTSVLLSVLQVQPGKPASHAGAGIDRSGPAQTTRRRLQDAGFRRVRDESCLPGAGDVPCCCRWPGAAPAVPVTIRVAVCQPGSAPAAPGPAALRVSAASDSAAVAPARSGPCSGWQLENAAWLRPRTRTPVFCCTPIKETAAVRTVAGSVESVQATAVGIQCFTLARNRSHPASRRLSRTRFSWSPKHMHSRSISAGGFHEEGPIEAAERPGRLRAGRGEGAAALCPLLGRNPGLVGAGRRGGARRRLKVGGAPAHL